MSAIARTVGPAYTGRDEPMAPVSPPMTMPDRAPSSLKFTRLAALAAWGLACSVSAPQAGVSTAAATAGPPVAAASPAQPNAAPVIAGCNVFPDDNIWNMPVDTLPRDPRSDLYVATIGTSTNVHADFGSGFWPEDSTSPIGIPYMVVPGDQPKVAVSWYWSTLVLPPLLDITRPNWLFLDSS